MSSAALFSLPVAIIVAFIVMMSSARGFHSPRARYRFTPGRVWASLRDRADRATVALAAGRRGVEARGYAFGDGLMASGLAILR
jgi:hypothetical protein